MISVPVGHIAHFTQKFPPPGWLLCNGTYVSRATYPELAEVCGWDTGTDMFKLPNLTTREGNVITCIKYREDEVSGSALDRQEGGSHYKRMDPQPIVFCQTNKLGFIESCVIKRMCRWQEKGGIGDLRKAIHEIEVLIELTELAEKREAMTREEAQNLKTDLHRRAMEGLAVKLGHPMMGDHMTAEAEQAVRDFVKAHPPRQRQCTCRGSLHETPPMCDCPPDVPMNPSYPELPLGRVNRAPAADSNIPGYCVPEGEKWPTDLPNGTRILVWRPRAKGDIGARLYGWVEIGFMWDGELVPHEAQG